MPKHKHRVEYPNGYGSVYKLSGNRRRPWVAVGPASYSIKNGKRKTKREIIGYFEDETEARRALDNSQFDIVVPREDMTLKEVYDEWYEIKEGKVSDKLLKDYKRSYDNRLKAYHKTKFANIRTSHLQKVIDDVEQGRATQHSLKCLLTQLYAYAIQNDIVNTNYALFLVLKKQQKKPKVIFNDLEIKKLWGNLSVPFVDVILIMIYTGVRVGELLDIPLFAVDIENRIIRGGSKTQAGTDRIIPIHSKILPLVKKRYDKKGVRLITYNGKSIRYEYFLKKLYYPALDQLKIDRKSPHSTRHTFATLMNKAGADKNYIKEIIGHSDYSTTANIYTHPDVEELKQAIDLI